jgi:hypothetical protein
MIHFAVRAGNRAPLETYFQTWGRALAGRVRVLSYEDLPHTRELPAGTYVFADLEQLSDEQTALAAHLWEQLAASGRPVRLLNHPRRFVRRYDLLAMLHARGENSFRAYRITELNRPPQFPVFLRNEDDHSGSRTELLRTKRELDRALARLFLRGLPLRDLLVVEFCDTSDAAGIFRKYSAFCLGGRILPRHLIFSREWMLKTPDLLGPERLREERDYLETNPHEARLREIFRLAQVDYGRMDYGVLGGRLQVWEINTNPFVMMHPAKYQPEHLPAQEWFAARVQEALEALDTSAPADARIPVVWETSRAAARQRDGGHGKEFTRLRGVRAALTRLRERSVFRWFSRAVEGVLLLEPRPLAALVRRFLRRYQKEPR